MAIQLHLNKSQLADMKAILELGPTVLGDVVTRIDALENAPLAPAELQAAIREVVQGNEEAINGVLRQALSLASLQRRRKLEVNEVLEGIRGGLTTSSEPWDAASITKWKEIEPTFRRLISLRGSRSLPKRWICPTITRTYYRQHGS
jgi:hypothetical protein